MSRSSWVALPDVQEWSGGPPSCLRVVEGPVECPGVLGRPSRLSVRPSQMSGSGREVLSVVREWLRGPPGCPRVVRKRSRMSGRLPPMFGSVRKALSGVREVLSDV